MNAFIVSCSDGEMAEFPEGNCDIGQGTQEWLQATKQARLARTIVNSELSYTLFVSL